MPLFFLRTTFTTDGLSWFHTNFKVFFLFQFLVSLIFFSLSPQFLFMSALIFVPSFLLLTLDSIFFPLVP